MVNLYFEQFEDEDDPYWMEDYYELEDGDYDECGCCCCTNSCHWNYDEDYDDYEYQQDMADGYMSELYDHAVDS